KFSGNPLIEFYRVHPDLMAWPYQLFLQRQIFADCKLSRRWFVALFRGKEVGPVPVSGRSLAIVAGKFFARQQVDQRSQGSRELGNDREPGHQSVCDAEYAVAREHDIRKLPVCIVCPGYDAAV